MSAVNEFLLSHKTEGRIWFAPRLTCVDGFSMSVQVHSGAYCCPRDGEGPDWLSAEIGFPSAEPSAEIMEYAEQPNDPTGTVYAYVPMEAIDRLVAEHGGIQASDAP